MVKAQTTFIRQYLCYDNEKIGILEKLDESKWVFFKTN